LFSKKSKHLESSFSRIRQAEVSVSYVVLGRPVLQWQKLELINKRNLRKLTKKNFLYFFNFSINLLLEFCEIRDWSSFRTEGHFSWWFILQIM